ncbi:flavo protein [Rhizoclosmatium globosum]|uniref:Flavo protein n=1 Tax=Rhizoclosmatium globosum TaxID=329046 RepID=A0A1Y2CWU6_9FUNG|nr:flavo protein [Rhizoclosmatium globosum]|eukprot:ORY51314.1 flavo protein [Rhizoclosmatium globosum]
MYGSVASIKIPQLVALLQSTHPNASIKVIATTHALHFFDRATVPVPVLTEDDEWSAWTKRSDPVLHIDLRNWADIMVVAPLDANTLAKLAGGLCDNLLTCILPCFMAPAMNTHMWNHPFTSKHLALVNQTSYKVIPPISKLLACGDLGMGAMAEIGTIVEHITEVMKKE